MYRVPSATYRLQFNAAFTFRDAARIVPYLADLGISDVYASPILRARKGSTHGYDVVDPAALNPELGSDDDFNALHEALTSRGLGLLLDVVPNHMAASDENAWWMSVLENGPHSRFLHYFDIDWSPVTAHGQTVNKVLLPILGRPYGESLEAREIQLAFDADGFFFRYYEKRLPLAPRTYGQVLAECVDSLPREGVAVELRELIAGSNDVPNSKFLKETIWRLYEQYEDFRRALEETIARINGVPGGGPESVNALDVLLDGQWYRLAYWRIANEKINYRRFFDVTDLVGVRIENPEVFEARNRRTLELIAEGKVTGLRIDHIDGLHDPIGHMRKLQLRLANGAAGQLDQAFYVIVEKILAHGERLPRELAVAGTTGYDFCDSLNALFVDDDGLRRLDVFYRAFTGLTASFADECYARKRQIIGELFAGEMRGLGKQLAALALSDRNARDFAPSELISALTEVTASLRVYRTYVRDDCISDDDRRAVVDAVAEARRRAGSAVDTRLLAFLERVLLLDPPSYEAEERERWRGFVMRWQQFTGRVMAKGVEDTAFYNYNRLVSLNEVGGDPGRERFDGLSEFHSRNAARREEWPHTLNATSTHDTKRSEDVRARIHVLSEMPDVWAREVRRWSKMNVAFRKEGAPHPNEELLIYQTLAGMWPLDEAERATVPARLKQYVEKAAREAKTHTSWLAPNTAYEQALLAFTGAILGNAPFMDAFLPFHRRIAFYGFLNALGQVVLKATSPGVPDFYQGSESWDFSLVDPDNRRPVDYELRRGMLDEVSAAEPRTLLRRWADGRIKLFVTQKTLAFRARHAALFSEGDYNPVHASGAPPSRRLAGRLPAALGLAAGCRHASRQDAGAPIAEHVVAFTRTHRDDAVLVAVPRFLTCLVRPGTMPTGDTVWPAGASLPNPGGRWRNIYAGETIEGDTLPLRRVFGSFPVAVLERA
jgi:(1->4)-alpha-D-glucan 1-alpha-D-glucosylmutase